MRRRVKSMALCVMAWVVLSAVGGGIELVKGGKALARIILAEDAAAPECFAAAELAGAIEAMKRGTRSRRDPDRAGIRGPGPARTRARARPVPTFRPRPSSGRRPGRRLHDHDAVRAHSARSRARGQAAVGHPLRRLRPARRRPRLRLLHGRRPDPEPTRGVHSQAPVAAHPGLLGARGVRADRLHGPAVLPGHALDCGGLARLSPLDGPKAVEHPRHRLFGGDACLGHGLRPGLPRGQGAPPPGAAGRSLAAHGQRVREDWLGPGPEYTMFVLKEAIDDARQDPGDRGPLPLPSRRVRAGSPARPTQAQLVPRRQSGRRWPEPNSADLRLGLPRCPRAPLESHPLDLWHRSPVPHLLPEPAPRAQGRSARSDIGLALDLLRKIDPDAKPMLDSTESARWGANHEAQTAFLGKLPKDTGILFLQSSVPREWKSRTTQTPKLGSSARGDGGHDLCRHEVLQ